MNSITPVEQKLEADKGSRKRERTVSTDQSRLEPPKSRARKTVQEIIKVQRAVADVTYDCDFKRSERNYVCLAPDLYSSMFGEDGEEGQYIKVANLVVRAYKDVNLAESQMDLNYVTYQQVRQHTFMVSDREKIWITPYDFLTETFNSIKEMRLRVYPCGTLNIFGEPKARAVLSSSMEKILKENFDEDLLRLGQELFINHPTVGPLKVVLEKWEHSLVSPSSFFSDEPLPYYGALNQDTKVNFVSGNRRELVLVDEMEPERLEKFYFNIAKVVDVSETVFSNSYTSSYSAWKKGVQPLPLLIPFPELVQKVRGLFSNKLILIGHEEKFRVGDWRYDIQFTKVKVKPSDTDEMNTDADEDDTNLKIFTLNDSHSLNVTAGRQVILTTSFENARLAKELTFEIIDLDRERTLKENEIAWLSVQQVAQAIKRKKPLMAHGSKVVIIIDGVKYLLKLVKESGDAAKKEHETSNIKDVWKVSKGTSIKVYADEDLGLEIVDTPKAYELDTVRVKVSTGGGLPPGLLAMFGGGEEDGEKTIIDEVELEKIFRESVCDDGIVHKKQTLKGLTGKGDKVSFKLEDLNPKRGRRKRKRKSYHGDVYKFTRETKVKFEGEKGSDLLISSKPKDITLENIDAKLIEFGIGGMKEEFKDIISRTILSRSTYADHIADIGQQPSRGLLLFGPPGTGKTLLARKLGEILGVTKERIKLITGSQIWNKWVGESEKNVRKMFEAARADQKRFGDESPLHLIIIDEIDAFLQTRTSDAKRWETSVVNTFLAELDGISSDGEDSLRNVIVVGLTNHPDRLDEAVKRPGRLFPHISIGIPDTKGRTEIFEIHSRKIREQGYLAEDVDVPRIVEMTVGRTGAFIEGMVTAAAEYSLKRLWENKVPSDKVKEHPASKLYMADFERAYDECIRTKKKKDQDITRFIPTSEIHMKSIVHDLARLRLGGFNEEVIKFLFDLKVSQHYKQFLYTMKHPFPRGVLFYGLPGTGKTHLAKGIQKLFNLDDQRFNYIKASELWPMRGSGLKEKIEEIIKPARAASADLKGEAPLHVVVVDEMDMMFLHKRETDTYDTSVMNQFLMELEPLFEEGNEEVHNLLVIGIAHRSILGIPEGIIRHGRLGKHVEVQPPKLEGRKAIFNIYLKEYAEKGFLDKKVSVDALAEMTKNYTGAYIEGLVSQAIIHSMRRVMKAGTVPGKIQDDPNAKLKMEDFRAAHSEMKIDPKWEGYII